MHNFAVAGNYAFYRHTRLLCRKSYTSITGDLEGPLEVFSRIYSTYLL